MPEEAGCLCACLKALSAQSRGPIGLERRYRRVEKRHRHKAQDTVLEANQHLGWPHFGGAGGGVRLTAALMRPGTPLGKEFLMMPEVVGRGGMSGDVKLGRWKSARSSADDPPSTDLVAIKRLEKKGLTKAKQKRLFEEAETYLKMDHPHVARLIRVCNGQEYIDLVMEYCSGGSLEQRLERRGRFPEPEARVAVYQMLSAVNYCHKHTAGVVCHRDLKSANFVYATEETDAPLKLIDFGLSRILSADDDEKIKGFAGTLRYMAPEVISQQAYDQSCDLWSIGVIAYSLLYGALPFDGSTESAIFETIREGKPQQLNVPPTIGEPATIPEAAVAAPSHEEGEAARGEEIGGELPAQITEEARAFISQLLAKEPHMRPKAEEALMLPWLQDMSSKAQMVDRNILERVRRFSHQNDMQRAVAAFIVYHADITAGEAKEGLEMAHQQFQALDTNNDGTISEEEFVEGMKRVIFVREAEAQEVFKRLDVDGDDKITRSEFISAAIGQDLLQDGFVDEAFQKFDLNRDGKIQLSELELALGTKFCGKPTKDIFKEFDSDQNGVIQKEEFKDALAGRTRGGPAPASPTRSHRPATRARSGGVVLELDGADCDQFSPQLTEPLSEGTRHCRAKTAGQLPEWMLDNPLDEECTVPCERRRTADVDERRTPMSSFLRPSTPRTAMVPLERHPTAAAAPGGAAEGAPVLCR